MRNHFVWIAYYSFNYAAANAGPLDNFPFHTEILRDNYRQTVQNLHVFIPNLKICYLSSRIYGGYATGPLNPEPQAYESGFSVKWLIKEQINGDPTLNFDPNQGAVMAKLLLWGPYLWADGVIPRSVGLVWLQEDMEQDGAHPSPSAEQKVADLLSDFFANDLTALPWFSNQGNTTIVAVDVFADAAVSATSAVSQLIFFWGVHRGWHGQGFFARVGFRNHTGLAHATRIFSCDKALDPAGISEVTGRCGPRRRRRGWRTITCDSTPPPCRQVIWSKLSLRIPTNSTAKTSHRKTTLKALQKQGLDVARMRTCIGSNFALKC